MDENISRGVIVLTNLSISHSTNILFFSRRSQKKKNEKNKKNRIQGFVNGTYNY